MRSGRRPSPEGTRWLFAGTINPMMCSVDGPTEGKYEKKTDGRQEKRAGTQSSKAKRAVLCPAGGSRTT